MSKPMSKNTTVSLTLQVKGNAGAELKRIADHQLKAVQKINSEQQKLKPLQEGQVTSAKKLLDEMRKQGTAACSKKSSGCRFSTKAGDSLTSNKILFASYQNPNHLPEVKHTAAAGCCYGQRHGTCLCLDKSLKVAQLNAELGKRPNRKNRSSKPRNEWYWWQPLQGAVAVGGAVAYSGWHGVI